MAPTPTHPRRRAGGRATGPPWLDRALGGGGGGGGSSGGGERGEREGEDGEGEQESDEEEVEVAPALSRDGATVRARRGLNRRAS